MAILGFFLFKSNLITLVLFYLGQNRSWRDDSVLKITGFKTKSVYMIMGCAISQAVLIPNSNLLLLVYNTFLGTSQINNFFLLSILSELSGTLWNSACHLLQIGRSIKIMTWSTTIKFFYS